MKKTIIYVLFSTIFFSSMEITLKIAGSSFNTIQLNLLRFFIGSLILYPLAQRGLRAAKRKITAKDWQLFALTGFLCVIVSMSLFQLAVATAPAAVVAVLFSCNPVFALLFAFLLLRERLSRTNLLAVVISLIGLTVIVNPTNLTNVAGISLSLGAAVTFGFYSIVSRYASTKLNLSGIVMTTYTFIAGTIELFILSLISKIPAVATWLNHVPGGSVFANLPIVQGISWGTLPMLLYIGIGVTGGGFALYFLAMERSNVSTASLVFFIKPGLAPILAFIFIHEQIPVTTIIGIVIILIGSVITFMGNKAAEQVDDLE